MHGVDRAASQALRRDLTIAARIDSRPNDMGAVEPPPESVEILYPTDKPLHSPFGAQPHPLGQADTITFIESLKELSELDQQALTGSLQLAPEQAAASSLFLWHEPIVVTRAPGRCDVLGGFGGVLLIHNLPEEKRGSFIFLYVQGQSKYTLLDGYPPYKSCSTMWHTADHTQQSYLAEVDRRAIYCSLQFLLHTHSRCDVSSRCVSMLCCEVRTVRADYSGAMVLQIPVDVACHVALQMQPVSEHRLWKHMQAGSRMASPGPVIRIVSMAADKNNRCDQGLSADSSVV